MAYTKQQYDDVMAGKITCMTRTEELALGREIAHGRIDPDNPPEWALKAVKDEELWLEVMTDFNFSKCSDYKPEGTKSSSSAEDNPKDMEVFGKECAESVKGLSNDELKTAAKEAKALRKALSDEFARRKEEAKKAEETGQAEQQQVAENAQPEQQAQTGPEPEPEKAENVQENNAESPKEEVKMSKSQRKKLQKLQKEQEGQGNAENITQYPQVGAAQDYGQPGFNIQNWTKDPAAEKPIPGSMNLGDVNPVQKFTSPVPSKKMVDGVPACGIPVAGQAVPQKPQATNPIPQQPIPSVWPPIGNAYFSMTPQEKQAYITQFIKNSNGAINDIPDYMAGLNDEGKAAFLKSRISMIPGCSSVLGVQGYGLLALLTSDKFKAKMLKYTALGGPDGARLVQVPIERYEPKKAKDFDMAFLVKQENNTKGGAILILFNSFPRYDFKERVWKWASNIDTCRLRKDETAFQEQRDVDTVQEKKPSQRPTEEVLATIGTYVDGILGNDTWAQKIKQLFAESAQEVVKS